MVQDAETYAEQDKERRKRLRPVIRPKPWCMAHRNP